MNRSHSHPLYVGMLADYEDALRDVANNLAPYRLAESIDWPPRVESWLSNFAGLMDQRLALEMLGRLRMVSEVEVVEACGSLLSEIDAATPKSTRIFHLSHETSGGLLVRSLEKKHGIRAYSVLRPSNFAKLTEINKLRDGDTVVVWDQFSGTGTQLLKLARTYEQVFRDSGKRIGSLRFAYVAGHAPPGVLSPSVLVHRHITDFPVVSEEEQAMCDRHATLAGKTNTNQKYETGALIAFADNPPNNVPLIFRAPPSASWFSLLDRRETARP